MQIYLDYSATTPCRPEAIDKIHAVLQTQWGNPSSLHRWGEQAATVLEVARLQVASLIHAPDHSIVFTSGGTESNNLAIHGTAALYSQPQHLIISAVEHSAISAPAHALAERGWEVSVLSVNEGGRVDPNQLKSLIQANTALISVIYGQSEIGTLQPIEALGAIAQAHGIPFHTDAVQVAGRVPIDVESLPIDLLSLSSHKLYGPQGSGALYLKPGYPLLTLLQGGSQESGVRPGTQALPAIAGFGIAAEYAQHELLTERDRLTHLRDLLFEQLADVPELYPTGDRHFRLPHHVSFCLNSVHGNAPTGRQLVREMNLAGIGISAGAACNSGKTTPSPILKALGFEDAIAQTGIRLTLGRLTTKADILWTAEVLKQILERHKI